MGGANEIRVNVVSEYERALENYIKILSCNLLLGEEKKIKITQTPQNNSFYQADDGGGKRKGVSSNHYDLLWYPREILVACGE